MKPVKILLDPNSRFTAAAYLCNVTDEELLAAQHFVLVTLRQVVEVGELVQRRVAAGEGGRRRQQQRVERYELPHVQLALPAKTQAEASPTGEGGVLRRLLAVMIVNDVDHK